MSLKWGSVYRRPDKTTGVYWVKFFDGGECHRESTGKRGDEGKAAAKDLLKVRQKEIHAATFRPGADLLRMKDLGKLLVADYELKGRRSLGRAKAALVHLEEYFDRTPATRIAAKVPDYIRARRTEEEDKPKAEDATVHYEIAVLRRCFTLAVRAGLLAFRPVIENVSVSNARAGFVDGKAFGALLDHLPDHLELPIRFAYATAWRVGEWSNLKWSDIDFHGEEIRLAGKVTKTGVPRTFPLVGEVKDIIDEAKARTDQWQREHGQVIPTVFWKPREGVAKPLGDFRTEWKDAVAAASLPWLLVHDLRRSAARRWSNAGVPDRVGMALGGWRTRSVYDRYGVVSKDDMRDGLERSAEAERTPQKHKA